MNTSPFGPTSGDDVALSLTQAGAPVAGSVNATCVFNANVVASSATRRPVARVLTGGTLLNTTYSVLPSADSTGAQLVAVFTRVGMPVTRSARTKVGVPLAAMRATPPVDGPPGTTLSTEKPKYTLPKLSLVSGV